MISLRHKITHPATKPFQTNASAEPASFFSKDNLLWIVLSLKETVTGVLLPLVDIGTDFVTAITHFIWGHYGWGALTILFIWLPGFVAAVAISVRGLRKNFTFQRLINYLIVLAALPFLYPIIQILV